MIERFYLTHKWFSNRYFNPGHTRSNDNDVVLHIPQSTSTGATPLDPV